MWVWLKSCACLHLCPLAQIMDRANIMLILLDECKKLIVKRSRDGGAKSMYTRM